MTRRPRHNEHESTQYRDDDTEVTVTYTITPYDPGVSYGPPESCYPPEGGEVEIVSTTVDGIEIQPTDAEIEAWSNKIFEEHEYE